jgi:hypothetical protein
VRRFTSNSNMRPKCNSSSQTTSMLHSRITITPAAANSRQIQNQNQQAYATPQQQATAAEPAAAGNQ